MDKHGLLRSSHELTILGASARAAAQSAVRAGYAPVCGDLFADEDLKACAAATRVTEYPAGLAEVCAGPQSGGWMYTGALENYPALIERLAGVRPLLGNSADVVRRVRNPFAVAAALARTGMPCPVVQRTAERLPRDGSWLRKPYKSAGGTRIESWDDRCGEVASDAEFYFQQRIEGWPAAAVYVANGRDAVPLGVTRQMIGGDSRLTMFAYRGSIGPIELGSSLRDQIKRLGEILAAEFPLVGLFGVDLIVGAETVWPVEINPRYTASVEVLERSLGFSAIDLHITACLNGVIPVATEVQPRSVSGKQILFAESELDVPAELTEYALNANRSSEWPVFADIPAAGTTIQAGWPILTVLADADDENELFNSLTHRRANKLLRP